MKKKNVLMMALSLALVAVIAVGGTLALMTAKTTTVQNTFTVGEGIQIKLDEAKVKLENGVYVEDATQPRVTSNSYDYVLPNVDHAKDPTVTLEKIPSGGVYVFVKVTGLDAEKETDKYTVSVAFNNTNWKNVGNGIYAYTAGETEATAVTANGPLPEVFSSVNFDYDSSDMPSKINPIDVIACAVQVAGTTPDEALTATGWVE